MSLQDDLLAEMNGSISLDPSVPIKGDTDLLLTGLVDSLGVLDIVAWIEDRLGATIDAGDIILEHFQTVNLIVAFAGTLESASS